MDTTNVPGWVNTVLQGVHRGKLKVTSIAFGSVLSWDWCLPLSSRMIVSLDIPSQGTSLELWSEYRSVGLFSKTRYHFWVHADRPVSLAARRNIIGVACESDPTSIKDNQWTDPTNFSSGFFRCYMKDSVSYHYTQSSWEALKDSLIFYK